MQYALIAVVTAVGLILLGLMYLYRVTDGDPVGYGQHIQTITNQVTQVMAEFADIHDGQECPSKRRFRRNSRCSACASKRDEVNALMSSIPKLVLAIGATAHYGRKFIAPVERKSDNRD